MTIMTGNLDQERKLTEEMPWRQKSEIRLFYKI